MADSGRKRIELEDLLASYPDIPPVPTLPGFQWIITAKEEFRRLASGTNEPNPRPGQRYRHQELVRRFLAAYDELFVLHETGTGKSCTVFGFTEYIKDLHDRGEAQFDKVYVLVKGPTHKEELIRQLVCACTADQKYEQMSMAKKRKKKGVIEERSSSREKGVISKIIREFYEFKTYQGFVAEFYNFKAQKSRLTDKEIIARYSNKIFWIDEVQNLRLTRERENIIKKSKQKEVIYNQIYRVFHLAQRCKRILTSATPMVNGVTEFGPLANLIIDDPDKEFPSDYDYSKATVEDINYRLEGKLSYVRGFETGAVRVDMGETVGTVEQENETYESHLKLYRVEMSEWQTETFMRAREISSSVGEQAWYIAERQASDFVFPAEPGKVINGKEIKGYWGGELTPEEKERRRLIKEQKREAERQKQEFERIGATQVIEGEAPLTYRGRRLSKGERRHLDIIIEPGVTPGEIRGYQKYVTSGSRGDDFQATEEFRALLGTINVPTTADDPEKVEIEANADDPGAVRLRGGRYVRYVREENRFGSMNPDDIEAILSNIYIHSAKYSTAIRLTLENMGAAFVYEPYVHGSGAIPLAICYEACGFVKFDEEESIFRAKGGIKTFCSKESTERVVRIEKSDGKTVPHRYGLLVGGMSPVVRNNILEVMLSSENKHSEYIKVLIVAQVGREAINVNNVTLGIIAGPEWTRSALHQAESRIRRVKSHEVLINDLRICLENEGADPNTATIPLRMYNLAAVTNRNYIQVTTEDDPDGMQVPATANQPGAQKVGGSYVRYIKKQISSDVELYLKGEYKDRQIRRFFRLLKQVCIDCQIHRKRNIRPGDEDGSAICDYMKCEYNCIDDPEPQTGDIDYSTFDVYYTSDIVVAIMDDIFPLFRIHSSIALTDLFELLPQYRPKYIVMAATHIIDERLPFTDQFGYVSYLLEDNGILYTKRAFPTNEPRRADRALYSQNLMGTLLEDLNVVAEIIEEPQQEELVDILEGVDPSANPERFLEDFQLLNPETKIKLMEKAVIQHILGDSQRFDVLYNLYDNLIFTFPHQPVTAIKNEEIYMNKGKRGRKSKIEGKQKVKAMGYRDFLIVGDESKDFDEVIMQDEKQPRVWAHIITQLCGKRVNYNNLSHYDKAEGPIRIYVEGDADWHDPNVYEFRIYNQLIQLEITRMKEYLEGDPNAKAYGIILCGQYYIRNKMTETPKKTKYGRDDRKKVNRGRVCVKDALDKIVDVLYNIGYENFELENRKRSHALEFVKPKYPKEKYPDYDINQWDDHRLLYYYTLLKNYHRWELCSEAYDYMRDKNQIWDIDHSEVVIKEK